MKHFKRAACSLILREDGLILGVSRKNDPNKFGLPGGKDDPEDLSLESAAKRELLEETGVIASGGIPVFTSICYGKDKVNYLTTTFMWHRIENDPKQIEGEGRVCWLSIDMFKCEYLTRETDGMRLYNSNLFEFLDIRSASKSTIIEV